MSDKMTDEQVWACGFEMAQEFLTAAVTKGNAVQANNQIRILADCSAIILGTMVGNRIIQDKINPKQVQSLIDSLSEQILKYALELKSRVDAGEVEMTQFGAEP